MPTLKARLVERFPEFAEAVHDLYEPGSNFNALCHEFEEVEERLGRLDASSEADAEQERHRLRVRRDSLEQELIALMQQTQRA
jgi:uncharacterized protein YdcH (DUF465 family)